MTAGRTNHTLFAAAPGTPFKATGDSCPDCGAALEYDQGEEQTRHEPGQMPCMHCAQCGMTFDVDWGRMDQL